MTQHLEFRDGLSSDKVTLSVATEEELLTFANKVREAGGANILEALLPSVKGAPDSCLIANALNFSCCVDGIAQYRLDDLGRSIPEGGLCQWGMYLPENMTKDRAQAIADAVECELVEIEYEDDYDSSRIIFLPVEIGNAAAAFDEGIAFEELSNVKED